jgi:hypothetical protein
VAEASEDERAIRLDLGRHRSRDPDPVGRRVVRSLIAVEVHRPVLRLDAEQKGHGRGVRVDILKWVELEHEVFTVLDHSPGEEVVLLRNHQLETGRHVDRRLTCRYVFEHP